LALAVPLPTRGKKVLVPFTPVLDRTVARSLLPWRW
jgi:hypothetical protein